MRKILYLQASPRGERSRSIQLADTFVEALVEAHPGVEVHVLNLFESNLPAFDGAVLGAKYAILGGQTFTVEQRMAWESVEKVIERFKSYDGYVVAVPMWNFGIPYVLKHYIDVLTQPGYTFSFSPHEGYKGLVTGKPAFLAFARGGEYSAPEAAPLDHQKPYLEQILRFIGFTDIHSVVVEPTLSGGPEVAARSLGEAREEAKRIAAEFGSAGEDATEGALLAGAASRT